MPGQLELTEKINDVEKDVAVLQSEARNYGVILTRLDDAISSMTQVSHNLERLLIVHEERIKTHADNLAAHKREVGEKTDDISTRINGLTERVGSLEKWRWYIGGVYAALAVIGGILLKVLFGA